VQTVIAKSFARIFYRNAFNIGFAVFECPELYEATQEGDILEVDAQQGLVSNLTRGGQFPIRPIPPFMKELIEAGGLIEWTRKKLQEASS
jgi:3-isopropylmalate dehydratase small subunit